MTNDSSSKMIVSYVYGGGRNLNGERLSLIGENQEPNDSNYQRRGKSRKEILAHFIIIIYEQLFKFE